MGDIRRKAKHEWQVTLAYILLRAPHSGSNIPSNIKFKTNEAWILVVPIHTDPEESLSLDLEMWYYSHLIMDPENHHPLIMEDPENHRIPITDLENRCHLIMDRGNTMDPGSITMMVHPAPEKCHLLPPTTELEKYHHTPNKECHSRGIQGRWFNIQGIMEWGRDMVVKA